MDSSRGFRVRLVSALRATGIDDLRDVFSDLLKNVPNAWHHENAILCKSREKVLIRWHNSVIRDSSGHIVAIASIGEDVTEHRLLERELLESSARERRHLAAELHDGLGQNLYAASLLARSLEIDAQKAALPITVDLAQLASVIGSSMETCRQIAHGLSPLAEIRGGFIRALQDLTSMPAKGGTEIALSIVGERAVANRHRELGSPISACPGSRDKCLEARRGHVDSGHVGHSGSACNVNGCR